MWAIQDEDADVVNISQRWEYDEHLNWTDIAFDYWAREEKVAIVSAAGNSGGSLASPTKGWNVISVGGSDNNETAAWSDDGMFANSSYVNPVGVHREKPEVVAPAVHIDTISLGGSPDWDTGTSFAAPQVAGLAALLMNRRRTLSIWPPAVKAIIMASAVHNVHGPSDIPTGQDLRDGAGAIDAALADEIAKNRSLSETAPCNAPCW
jgi:subtilisin family serine protease